MRKLFHILAVVLTVAFCAAAALSCKKDIKPDTGKTVNTDGGTVTVDGVTLDIPDGALESPVKIVAAIKTSRRWPPARWAWSGWWNSAPPELSSSNLSR